MAPDATDSALRVSTALREGTKDVHRQAEDTVLITRIFAGAATQKEYVRLLRALRTVYEVLEAELEAASSRDANTRLLHFPRELSRTYALADDIAFHSGGDSTAMAPLRSPAIDRYVERMRAAARSSCPWLIVAHSYTRHLGDLSGGQILSRRIRKLFPSPPSGKQDARRLSGVAFYTFDLVHDPAGFKSMFRDRLNAMELSDADMSRLVDEAIEAFKLNIGLFEEIEREMGLERPRVRAAHAHGHGEDAVAASTKDAHTQLASVPYALSGLRVAVLVLVVGLAVYYVGVVYRNRQQHMSLPN